MRQKCTLTCTPRGRCLSPAGMSDSSERDDSEDDGNYTVYVIVGAVVLTVGLIVGITLCICYCKREDAGTLGVADAPHDGSSGASRGRLESRATDNPVYKRGGSVRLGEAGAPDPAYC